MVLMHYRHSPISCQATPLAGLHAGTFLCAEHTPLAPRKPTHARQRSRGRSAPRQRPGLMRAHLQHSSSSSSGSRWQVHSSSSSSSSSSSLALPWRHRHLCHTRRRPCVHAVGAAPAAGSDVEVAASVGQLISWIAGKGAPISSRLEPKRFKADAAGERVGLIAAADAAAGDVLLELPDSLVVTSVDAEKHGLVGALARDSSELVALTLWLMAERARGASSPWATLLHTLPEATASPILWEDQVRAELLQGSPVLAEARQRQAALQEQWAALAALPAFSSNPEAFPPSVFNEPAFLRSFCVVLACAAYLPSAECFALVPVASCMSRSGNDNGCNLDYDPESSTVKVITTRPYREGQEVLINDGRPNGEMLLSTGTMQDGNLSDCLLFKAQLVPADKYYSMKQQLLESFGFSADERFPVFSDRFPIQLLSYLRLSRIQDPLMFAKVNFEADVVISQMNEYEVLQLLMGDCREALASYKTSLEEDTKALQQPSLTGRERLAVRLRLAEKTILSQTMDAVRRRLAPIRGIPTKAGGMTDPNSDIKEVFDLIEGLPTAPVKMFDNLRRWAKGEFDDEWNK